MAAVNRPLYIEQGATFPLAFTWHMEGPVVSGVVTPGDPYDLTGCIARMQIRKAQGEPVLLAATSESTGPGADRIVIDGPTGRIAITLTDEDTDSLNVSTCVYDLEVEWPIQVGELAPRVDRLLQGAVVVSPNITQEVGDPIVGP